MSRLGFGAFIWAFSIPLLLAQRAVSSEFSYLPSGDLTSGSGTGRVDCRIHAPDIRFPIEAPPSFANSQVYNPGGGLQPYVCTGGQCCVDNYSYPWRDNFCETRSGTNSLVLDECPDKTEKHHAGQDIRAATCQDNEHWVVAVSDGTISLINEGKWLVQLTSGVGESRRIYNYLHMDPLSLTVTKNQGVKKGQRLGKVSDDWIDSTTRHLHFEIYKIIDDVVTPVSPYMSLVESYRRLIGPIDVTLPVRATTTLPVHTTPGGSSSTLIPADAVGTVVGGPEIADFGDYCWRWWRVDWGEGIVGWVVDNYLVTIQCVPLTAGSAVARAVQASCGTPLSVTLAASPSSGSAPLNDVGLTASVGGSATGPITYTFYCNRSDSGTNITSGYAARYSGISTNQKTAVGVCDYSSPGTYTAKVIVERGSEAAEARRTITVGSSGVPVPEVSTLAATSVTQASATFNATVHPNNSTTTYWFDYGTSTSVNLSTSPQTLAAATSQSAVSISQGGLACGQQYFYRARASNAGGLATPGDILSFTTDACGSGGSNTEQLVADPSFEAGDGGWWVTNEDDFYIDDEFDRSRNGDFYAYLSKSDGTRGNNLSGGFISPHITIPADATDADLRFWYSITSDETTASTVFDKVDVYLVRPPDQLNLITTISNLDENGASYSLEAKDLSSSFYGDTVQIFFAGSTDGSLPTVFRIDDVTLDVDLPSGSAPAVTTQAADQVTASSARLNMAVDPNGDDTTVWFDLEAGDSTPNDDSEHISVGSGSQSEDVSISVFGLDCGTLYYFRANAQNGHGSDQGIVRSFTTSACSGGAPNADTDPAVNVTQTSATLTADVDPNGLPTQAWFAWGDEPSLGQETPHSSVGSGTGNVDFSQTLTGLACDTTYYFENHAENSAGHDDGATLEFTTQTCEGGGSPAQGFFLDFRRQGCSGDGPAVLLWWTAPAEMDNVFTVRRADGGYAAAVDSSQGGMAHLVSNSLVPGETYSFFVEGTLDGTIVQTNAVTVPVLSDECGLPVGSGELPHLPLLWAGTPFCSGGTASVPLLWTAVGGAASYTLTRIDNVATELIPYPGLTGTSMIDSGLLPGAAYEYMVDAVGSGGSRKAGRISVFVPSGVCGEPSTPGPFSAQVSEPVCDAEGTGAVTVSWTTASDAASGTRTYWADDGFRHGSGKTFTGTSRVIDGIRPGALFKIMVQAESATTPRQYHSIIMAQHIPLDVCGGGTLPPAVPTTTAPYIQEQQALLHATIVPTADASTAFFEWGTTASYGSTTPVRNTGGGYRSVSLGEVITGLSCGTTYHFRAVAVTANGRTNGMDQSFTTPPCDPTQCSVSMVSPTGGEIWVKGTPQTVRWTASPGCVSFSFRLLRGGLHDGWIDTEIEITGTEHAWTPAAWLIPGSDLQLEVAGYDAAGHGSAATSNSFSLINPAVLPPVLFEETVETEMSNWHYEGWGITNSTAHSPTHSRTDSRLGLYENNANRSLYPPQIDISGRRSVLLTLWERHDFATLDSGNVWVSADGGPFVHVRGFTGTQLEWRPATINLAQFIGRQTIRIAFQVVSDGSLTADGWYIDDIKIYEPPPTDFYSVTPCRATDTRQNSSPLFPGNVSLRTFAVAGACGIPSSARAVSLNVTAVNSTGSGYIKLFPADHTVPPTSTVSFAAGQVRANNSILGLSEDGRLAAVFDGSGQVDLILDVNGYFADRHPMVGVWRGTVAGYAAEMTIEQSGGIFGARLSMDQANDPVEQLDVHTVTETTFVASRPADNNAELRLSLTQSGTQQCFVGDYIENGGYRPISLCKAP